MKNYVHGYSPRELKRLHDQANTLDELLHHDTVFPKNSKVLEVGCGVGSQTKIIAPQNPTCQFTSLDISESSLVEAKKLIGDLKIKNVEFALGDIFNLPFEPESFDHVFVCFVLEHLAKPLEALHCLKKVLKKGGTITVIEGDHGSTFFYPKSDATQEAIGCQIELQRQAGGNALIGREVFPLLSAAGFTSIQVTPRMVYVDASRPKLVDGFTKKTFTAMIEGVKEAALTAGLTNACDFDRGIKDLYRTTKPDGVFCYTFFKGVGKKGERAGLLNKILHRSR